MTPASLVLIALYLAIALVCVKPVGLYIANAIVSGHEGRIDVDSSSERGTTFTIHLPRDDGG